MKTYLKLIIILVLSMNGFSAYSQNTWEYFYRDNDGNNGHGYDELILNMEEINNGDLITTAWRYYDYYHQNDAPAIIRLHNGETGKVYKEVEYFIDTLTPSFDWIFYDKKSEIFTIVGSAQYIDVDNEYIRSYFLLTRWDNELNLLKDTIVKLESPYKIINLWYFNGAYTKEKDYLVFGKYYDKFSGPPTNGNIEILLKINKLGNIIKKKFNINNQSTGQHSNLLEDPLNERYILLGPRTYFLDSDFNIINSIYNFNLPDSVRFSINHTTVKLFPPDKLLLTAQINNFHRGVALTTLDLDLIKSRNLTTNNDPSTIEFLLGRRSLDYKDTSSIYIAASDYYHYYYTLSRVNSELEPYWIKYYSEGDSIAYVGWTIKATLDGGCIFAGKKGLFRNPNSNSIYHSGSWMKKFDANGNTVAVKETTKSSWDITVFPNPSQGDFKIEIGGNAQNAKLRIFDLQGKEVKIFDKLLSGTNHLNMYELSQGMYIWKLEKGEKIIGTGKWVKK